MKKTGIIIGGLVIIGIIVMAIFSPQDNMGIDSGAGNNIEENMNNEENQNGLIIETLQEGEGTLAENGKLVTVHYTGTLLDGTKFDSSVDRDQPFQFTLGIGQVIKGWDQGVLGMKVGEKRRLTIPADLAYGDYGAGHLIGPGETLIFEVELLAVN
jgi:FKBP-type peptidyl-prolyl cis-trans isomerase